MVTLPEPNFIDRDPAAVTAGLITMYESLTGKVLQPAQPERLIIDLIAYRETLLRIGIQEAAKQCLAAYATGYMLDYLGALVTCNRLPAQPASCQITFALAHPLPSININIPSGTIIVSSDNLVQFATAELLVIPHSTGVGTVTAVATTAGIIGNGYQPGDINTLLEPVEGRAVTNITASTGGLPAETDDHYRDRITSAPESYAVAGPTAAYRYHAMSVATDIIDVAVIRGDNGVITLCPLLESGLPDDTLLGRVLAACNADTVRPLSDTVLTMAPVGVPFSIEAYITLYEYVTEPTAALESRITTLLAAYTDTLAATLGNDLVLDQLRGVILTCYGVYSVRLTAPLVDRVIEPHEWLHCTGISVAVEGYQHG